MIREIILIQLQQIPDLNTYINRGKEMKQRKGIFFCNAEKGRHLLLHKFVLTRFHHSASII